jgi:hypothetical protein
LFRRCEFCFGFSQPITGSPYDGWFSCAYLDFFSLFRRV